MNRRTFLSNIIFGLAAAPVLVHTLGMLEVNKKDGRRLFVSDYYPTKVKWRIPSLEEVATGQIKYGPIDPDVWNAMCKWRVC